MKPYVLSKLARSQIMEVWLYIAQDKMDAAENWLVELEEAFARLGSNPGIGRSRPHLLEPSNLFWPVGQYLIIYRQKGSRIQIKAVVHGARDLGRVLKNYKL